MDLKPEFDTCRVYYQDKDKDQDYGHLYVKPFSLLIFWYSYCGCPYLEKTTDLPLVTDDDLDHIKSYQGHHAADGIQSHNFRDCGGVFNAVRENLL